MIEYTFEELSKANRASELDGARAIWLEIEDKYEDRWYDKELGYFSQIDAFIDSVCNSHKYYIKNLDSIKHKIFYRHEYPVEDKANRVNRLLHKSIIFKKLCDKYEIKQLPFYVQDCVDKGLDILEYAERGYSLDCLDFIGRCLNLGLDAELLTNKSYTCGQMSCILKGLMQDLDVSPMLDNTLEVWEMNIIHRGLYKGFDLAKYVKANYEEAQIVEIEAGLENGLDVSYYDKREYTAYFMELLRSSLADDIDILGFFHAKYNITVDDLLDLIDIEDSTSEAYAYALLRCIRVALTQDRDILDEMNITPRELFDLDLEELELLLDMN